MSRAILVAALICAPRAAFATSDDWLGADKGLHFGVSALLANGGYEGSAFVLDRPRDRALVGAGFALSFGVGKELYDLGGRGDPSFKDLTWDAVGTLVGIGFSLAIDLATGDRQSWLSALRGK